MIKFSFALIAMSSLGGFRSEQSPSHSSSGYRSSSHRPDGARPLEGYAISMRVVLGVVYSQSLLIVFLAEITPTV